MDLDDFVAKLDGVRSMPSGLAARCPAHDDHVASLSINAGDSGGIIIKCHAGCIAADIMAALGLSISDLMGAPHVVEVYNYVRADRSHAYRVERWANPKTFRCPEGLPDPADRVLYQLPWIEWARVEGRPVYVVEGERDVHTLLNLGTAATCNVGGAGKWLPHYAESLDGLDVVVVADNDQPGRTHARAVATALKGRARSVALVYPPTGKDVSDFLGAGYALDKLVPLPETDNVGSYRADRIRCKAVSWAWAGYLPLGKLSLIEGDPGDGKSLLSLDLTARWTTGTILPDGSNGAGPWPVILVSAEDDPEDTLVPRLMAAGARLDLVHLITHGITPELPFDLLSGSPALERLAMQVGARAIVLDPLSAFLTDGTDSHNDHSVRRALQPLKMLAERTGAAVLAVRHLNKGATGTKALYRSSGSIGFIGAARAGFIVGRDPSDDNVRVFACSKSNLAARPPALRYEICKTDDGVPFIKWRGPADLSAQIVLDGAPRERSEAESEAQSKKRQRDYAGEFLLDILSNGPMGWAEIVEAGKADGFTSRTLERARADIGLRSAISMDGGRRTLWHRPDTSDHGNFANSATSPAKNHLGVSVIGGGEVAKLGQQSDVSQSDVSAEDPESRLENLPEGCEVCQSVDGVSDFGTPWFVRRCKAHNPMFYGGE